MKRRALLYLTIYNIIVVPLLWAVFRLGGLVNTKIRSGIVGRKFLFERLRTASAGLSAPVRIWFHASSLGEFEQAKPIITEIKKRYPQSGIIATFFSPSGFENSKHYKHADIISYIPFDSAAGTRAFIETVRPDVAVMVRYDIWPNMIFALQKAGVPTFIANATMHRRSLRTLPVIAGFHRTLYDCFTMILTVSENDRSAFESFGTRRPRLAAIGDTRFDQVMQRSIDARHKHLLTSMVTDARKIFVVGQSWPEDDEVIIPVILKMQLNDPALLTIFVPHEPTVDHLEALESQLDGKISHIRFSEMNNYHGENVIVIDSIGILVALYQYAHVVYVGGSFRQGIHNVLEPAVFGVPILFGPKHTNSQEAVELARRGGAFVVHSPREVYRRLRTLLHDPSQRTSAGAVAESYVRENCGATERFLHFLQPYMKQ